MSPTSAKKIDERLPAFASAWGVRDFVDFDTCTEDEINNLAERWGHRPQWFNNQAYICGRKELVLGFFKDKHRKHVAFFHEIGHLALSQSRCICSRTSRYQLELMATMEGLRIARQYGLTFPDAAIHWAIVNASKHRKDLYV
jgi:hypothetical protein